MIVQLDPQELDRVTASFWPVTQDLTRSGYPTYTDGVKTFADFADTIRRAAAASWGEVLVHVLDGEVNGLAVVETVDDDYLSLSVCLARARQEAFLTELLADLTERYAGRTLWLGFAPENGERLAFAKANGFTLLDDSTNWIYDLSTWKQPMHAWRHSQSETHTFEVGQETYPDFRCLWTDTKMYWNADRIAEHLDEWRLFVAADEGETPLAAVACQKDPVMQEIFGFMYKGGYDPACHQGLLCACLNTAKRDGARYLTYFAEQEENTVMDCLGFRRVSGYVCYEKRLR